MIILYLFLIVGLHELAHLIAAKKLGCGVDVFSIGFGKPIFKKTIGKTIYQISPFLLGGFCKLKDETSVSSDKDAFINLPYRKKIIIILAGVVVNIILGLIAAIIGKQIGNSSLYDFGYWSFWIGLSNAIPIFPCLDGGYAIFIPILFKMYGKEKGTKIFEKLAKQSFILVNILSILSVIYLLIMFLL